MSKTAVVTARLDPETVELVDRVARAQGRSRAWYLAHAVRQAAEHDAAFMAFIQEGIDSADRGELTPHDDVMREFRQEFVAKAGSVPTAG